MKLSKIFEEILTEKKGDKYDSGAVMLKLDVPKKWWDKMTSKIDKDDVYVEDGDRTFGIEDEPHITVLYGLDKDVPNEDVEEIVEKIKPFEIELKNISAFENEKYDVLKFDIDNDYLHELNKMFKELPYKNDFPDYKPHATIGYLKVGTSKEYVGELDDEESLTIGVEEVVYSRGGGDKKTYKLK